MCIFSISGHFTLAIFSGGPWEFALIGFILIILFGNRVPRVAKSIG